jgi:ribose transport system substrate-binding protein
MSAPRRSGMAAKAGPLTMFVLGSLLVLSACSDASTASGNNGDGNSSGSANSPIASTCSTKGKASSDPVIADAQEALQRAAGLTTKWDGPTDGPTAQPGKSVVFIPATSQNAGDIGVLDGLKEAAKTLDWDATTIDGGGAPAQQLAAFNQALALKPDAIAVSSLDAKSFEPSFAKAKKAGIVVVGNHTGDTPGPQDVAPSLFTNVTSDPQIIAQVAADCALVATNGKAKVTIQSCGSEVQICATKRDSMADEIEKCRDCKVLALNDFPYGEIAQRMPGIATADLQRFGSELNVLLSINDGYWDAAIPAIQAAGVPKSGPPVMIAAGDGSPAAYDRIRDGEFQIATVAEPLAEHGWQVADEIVRALAGEEPSDFVTYPHLVTIENVDLEGGDQNVFDPGNGYRDKYKAIWGVG